MRLLRIGLTVGLIGLFAVPVTAQTTYTCLGQEATVVGTPERDFIHDGAGTVIVGLGGDDDIDGSVICGGKGRDTLEGAEVSGGPDDDFIIGFPGTVAHGGPGNDTFWDTSLTSGAIYKGNAGNDHYHDNGGDDVFYGGPGNDLTHDGESSAGGADRIYGGDGDDSLDTIERNGADGPDFVSGGQGNDTCVVSPDDTYVGCETVTVT